MTFVWIFLVFFGIGAGIAALVTILSFLGVISWGFGSLFWTVVREAGRGFARLAREMTPRRWKEDIQQGLEQAREDERRRQAKREAKRQGGD